MIILVHRAKPTSEEFVKLIMLLVLGQYLLYFPIDLIEHIAKLDSIGDTETCKAMMEQFKSFQLLSLDELINELYSAINPLYHSKEPRNSSKLKLQETLVCIGDQILFHYSFCYVVVGDDV
jgi:hypothetical protein